MPPINVLHFADSHIGMENFGRFDGESGLNSRVRDFLRRLDEMIDFAREHDVDLTIFAGDAFKTRTPSPTLQDQFALRVMELAALAPVVLLEGNHDLPPADKRSSSVAIYDTLRVPNVHVADSFDVFPIETKRGCVVVGAAPYPLRQRLLRDEQTAGMTIAEIDDLLRAALFHALEDMAAQADREAGDAPRLLTGHFTIDGATWGSERGVMLGRDVAAPLSALADERWDYVAMGHIHRHQNLTQERLDAPPVVYSGSIDRVDFGEESEVKGFCWVELERQRTRWAFRHVRARPFVTLRADLRKTDDPTRALLDEVEDMGDLSDAVVRVRVQLTPDNESSLQDGMIRDALRAAGANFVAPFQKEIDQGARARLGISPEGLTDAELLDRYLLSREVVPERRRRLLEAAQPIFEGQMSAEEA
jgi:exonuclease SbcD